MSQSEKSKKIRKQYVRICRVEPLEERQMLSVAPSGVDPLTVGAVYTEGAFGDQQNNPDTNYDQIEVKFIGGAKGTNLDSLTIDLDKNGDGISLGDAFFHLAQNDPEYASYGYYPFTIEINGKEVTDGSVQASFSKDNQLLTLSFKDFTTDDTLVLKFDVDEYDLDGVSADSNAIVEGKEFQNSKFSATFSCDNYENVTISDIRFRDVYDVPSDLNLPEDGDLSEWGIDDGEEFMAGGFESVVQTPLIGSISGYVYEDCNVNSVKDSPDVALSNVTLTLYELVDGQYQNTGLTTTTNSAGYYKFDNLFSGTYQVVETQPQGYDSVSANAGYIQENTAIRSTVLNVNCIYQITLEAGQNSIENNFGEYIPNSLSGHVYYDQNNDGLIGDPGIETRIEGAKITVTNLDDGTVYTDTTDENGFWFVGGLTPGRYEVTEEQPDGYIDGLDAAGNLGGTPHNPNEDWINNFSLTSGMEGVEYNFGELKKSCIKGIVFLDSNQNDIFDDGDKLLQDVEVQLLDANGNLLMTKTTDSDGKYSFCFLEPGTYTVREIYPDEYIHSGQIEGTTGGKTDIGLITDIPIVVNESSYENNFWEVLPGMISGYVFEDGAAIEPDANGKFPDQYVVKDGVKKNDSVPIAGVTLGLYNLDGTVPITDEYGNPRITTTDENGYYEFTHLTPGSYAVLEIQPTGYKDCIDTPGEASNGVAFNPCDSEYEVKVSTFGSSHNNDGIVRISVKAGENTANNNFSEVVFTDPTPPEDPRTPGEKVPLTRYGTPGKTGGAGYMGPSNYNYFPSMVARMLTSLYGGGGGMPMSAWHLSVINAGMPRRLGDNTVDMNYWHSPIFDPVNWTGANDSQYVWEMVDWQNSSVTFSGEFGTISGVPLTGDFNGDGKDEVALFIDGTWFIDINGNGKWDEEDLWVQLGGTGDQPVVGDWDGDGKADIGVYGKIWTGDWNVFDHEPGLPDAENLLRGQYKNMPKPFEYRTSGERYLKLTKDGEIREDAIDHVFYFGADGDLAVTGDWNGDGISNVGVFNSGNWYLDVDGNGKLSSSDKGFEFGQAGDLPVTGDWNGDGVTNLGVYRNGKFILDTNGNGQIDEGDAVVEVGQVGDRPVVGDFNGDGIDEVGTVKLVNTNDVK